MYNSELFRALAKFFCVIQNFVIFFGFIHIIDFFSALFRTMAFFSVLFRTLSFVFGVIQVNGFFSMLFRTMAFLFGVIQRNVRIFFRSYSGSCRFRFAAKQRPRNVYKKRIFKSSTAIQYTNFTLLSQETLSCAVAKRTVDKK